tara:strand:+ start:505 stop:849 length:345 start_codon:yes stop_codon:yes gene_type:complete
MLWSFNRSAEVVQADNRIVVNSNDPSLLKRSHQLEQLTTGGSMETQRRRSVVQPPEGVIASTPGGTTTTGPAACLQDLNGSLPVPSPQSSHQGATGQSSSDHSKIDILARHGIR